jgi:hypothetical protein
MRYNTDIYIAVRRRSRFYECRSKNEFSFPPSLEDLVSQLIRSDVLFTMDINWFKDKAYPLPIRRTAADFEGGTVDVIRSKMPKGALMPNSLTRIRHQSKTTVQIAS